MRRADKRRQLQTLLRECEVLGGSRTRLRALGSVMGEGRAADVDALLLKLDSVLNDAIQEVAIADETEETRTAEQQAADAKLVTP